MTRNGFGGLGGRLWVPVVPVGVLARAMIDVSIVSWVSGVEADGCRLL